MLAFHLSQQLIFDDIDGRERNAAIIQRLKKRESVRLASHCNLHKNQLIDLAYYTTERWHFCRRVCQEMGKSPIYATLTAIARLRLSLQQPNLSQHIAIIL